MASSSASPSSPTSSSSSSLPPTGMSAGHPMRCIAHIDMDCFYAQVEAVRLGIDCRTTPFVCVQWGGFIAVNYPARALGVRRFRQTAEEAQREHPTLQLGHIATYAIGELEYGYPPSPKINTHKVSLEPYRAASRQIFAILRSEPGVVVGKAGIDEAYVDVTVAAQRELAELQARRGDAAPPLDAVSEVLEPSTRLIADRRAEMQAWFTERGTSLAAVFDTPMRALLQGGSDGVTGSRGFCVSADDAAYAERCRLLCAASRVVQRLRQRIYTELHYDCSAGIAHNRGLAKCISATHKPNQQTLLLPDRSASALFELPLSELRGFGGKFGAAVRAVCGGATVCRELWQVPLSQLSTLNHTAFYMEDDEDGDEAGGDGEEDADDAPAKKKVKRTQSEAAVTRAGPSTAEYVYYRIRGVNTDTVADPAAPRGMEASKVFHPSCTSWSAARLWMAPLAGELWHRFQPYESRYYTEGRSLAVYVRTYVSAEEVRHGRRSQSYRRHLRLPVDIDGAAMLAKLGLSELEKLMSEVAQVDIAPSNLVFHPHGPPTIKVAEGETTCEERPATTAPVPMPPLRVIGLSIIGLRLRGTGDGDGRSSADGGGTAAPGLPQRSLKNMFADWSARETAPRTTTAAPAAPAGASTSSSVVEVNSVEEERDGEEGLAKGDGVGSGHARRRSRRGVSPSSSFPTAATPSALPPPRHTLEHFFHPTPTTATAAVAETEGTSLAERSHDVPIHLRSSTSVIEVSSDDDDEGEEEVIQ